MVQFTRLRLSGFKSFVEPTELLIEEGLTGVVGPNGCGKSNLLEGLRWVMGEVAARKLRGGEMDDIIFGGTEDRPGRNIAEVVVNLDNSDRGAPAAFNDSDEIEIIRRIQRGHGSTFRVNGREVRARDVQLVFADSATGARSTALVSQGRIGELIAARPVDRRGLLEEAAGITGLHSRRHEAELRLRGAENNLDRLDDVLAAFEGQLQGLKRQARQATRYRNISDHIRRAEAILLHLRWRAATADLEAARERLSDAGREVTEKTAAVAEATTLQATVAATLPPLREAEAAAAAAVHRLTVAREQLDAEEARVIRAREEAEARLEQIAADLAREDAREAEARETIERLTGERDRLAVEQDAEADSRETAAARLAGAEAAAAAAERLAAGLGARVAADEARRDEIATRLAGAAARLERLGAEAGRIAVEREQLAGKPSESGGIDRARAAVEPARRALEAARDRQLRAGEEQVIAEGAEREAREAHREAESTLDRIVAEADGIAALMAGDDEARPPVLDALTVEPGLEIALGAALGDDLSAPADDDAPVHWRRLPPLTDAPALPEGAEPLSAFVRGSPALDRRLASTGLVPDVATGQRLAPALRPGLRLVTRDGALWRWDGYTVVAGAATSASARLEQRNRLAELGQLRGGATERLEAARRRAENAGRETAAASAAAASARARADTAFTALTAARDRLAEEDERHAEARSRLAALGEAAARIAEAVTEASREHGTLADIGAGLADPAADREKLAALGASLDGKRAALVAARQTHDALGRESEIRGRRLVAIDHEAESWRGRLDDAARQIARLGERREAARAAAAELADRPAGIAASRNALMNEAGAAEATRREAADRLAVAEARLGEAEQALRAIEAALADLREGRGLAEGALRQAEQASTTVAERIAERLGATPDGVLEAGDVKPDTELPEIEAIETRFQRLQRERDNMGPVNLRAEAEARELQEQMEALRTEKDDLTAAIARFRQAISELNREGRKRLLDSFSEVDRHFREVFERLFSGGRAHLSLTEADDPLEAGLEILASPPGKRLQSLSLLSGGEQTLTALALLFAVFLTNPAPICVLDEVDAPLDDANVDRFCALLEEISSSSDTRFLLITHHRMTMARMDRLFGVTMPESGVSQLVSVDLQGARKLRESA